MNRSSVEHSRINQLVHIIWNDQRVRFASGETVQTEEYFELLPEITRHSEAAVDVIYHEYLMLIESRKQVDPDRFRQRFPQWWIPLKRQLSVDQGFASIAESGNDSKIEITQAAHDIQQNSNPVSIGRHEDFGNYQILDEVGRGTFAIVHRALDRRLNREVAIKIPRVELADSEKLKKTFMREARTVAQLFHPSIVSVIDVGEHDNRPFIVSDLIDGMTLESRLNEDPPSQRESAKWISELAIALHYAHQNNIVHRDVKPANVILDKNGHLMLTDFGLAQWADSAGTMTREGDLLGTPSYMSPEQAAGRNQIDSRTDVYSLGVILYRCLTGRLPFEGSIASTINQVIHSPVDLQQLTQRSVPRDLSTITIKCLSKSPDDRYQTAMDLSQDLERYLKGEPIDARAIRPFEKLAKLLRRNPRTATLAIAILLLSGFVAGISIQLGNVIVQRDRARVAKQQANSLTASAAFDAGLLALQQGNFQAAANRFEQCLKLEYDDPVTAHLMLVQCYVAKTQAALARQHLNDATRLDTENESLATIAYWNCEIALIDSKTFDESLDILNQVPLTGMSIDQREFLLGMNSTNSIVAKQHFANAIQRNSHHHSARRSWLIMLLALAQFDDVIREVKIAQQLYPQDDDFLLIEALAFAATNDVKESRLVISTTGLDRELKAAWLDMCEWIASITIEINNEDTQGQLNLAIVSKLAEEYQNRFLPLILQRRWHFPPAISKLFVEIENFSWFRNKTDAIVRETEALANAHPESSLLTLAGRAVLDNRPLTEKDLEKSRDLFMRARQRPGYLRDAQHHARIGSFATAARLSLVEKHDVERNSQVLVDTISEIEPNSITRFNRLRTITIALIQLGKWQLAEPWAYRWAQLTETNNPEKLDALWHYGVVLEHQKAWVQVLEVCDRMLEIDSELTVAQHLKAGAKTKLSELIN